MADYGLAALSGLLNGLGGLPAGMVQREKLDQSQEHLNLLQQQMAQQQAQFEAGKFLDVPSSAVPSNWSGKADPATGMVKVPTAAFPTINQQRNQELQQEAQGKQGSALAMAFTPLAKRDPTWQPLVDALQTGVSPDKIAPIFEKVQAGQAAAAERNQNRRMALAVLSQNPNVDVGVLSRILGIDLGSGGTAPPPPQPGPARMTPTTFAPGGEVATGDVVGGIPMPLPAAQQPIVQAAGSELGRALDNQNAIRSGLPGVPPPASTAPPRRSPYGVPTLSFGGKEGLRVTMSPDKPPTDDKDSWASALFGVGKRFADLDQSQQRAVMDQIGNERVRVSREQGAAGQERKEGLPLLFSVPQGQHIVDVKTKQLVNPIGSTFEELKKDPNRYVTLDTNDMRAWKTINETRSLMKQFDAVVGQLTDQPGSNIAQGVQFWAQNTLGMTGPGADLSALQGAQLRIAGAMQGSRVQLSDQDRKSIQGLIPAMTDTKQMAQNKLRILNNILDAMENAQLGISDTQAAARIRQGIKQAEQLAPVPAPASGGAVQRWGRDKNGRPVPLP